MLRNRWGKTCLILWVFYFLFLCVLPMEAFARAGGGRSSGSKTEPVKFEEYWAFTRPVGNNPWQLSAINQAE